MATVYITREDSGLYKKGKRLIVKQGQKKISDVPMIKVDQIVIFGNASISGSLINLLLKAEVPITYLSYYGNYRGRLVPKYSKNSLLRLEQFSASSSPDFCLELSKKIVEGKLTNMRTLLLRDTREKRGQKAEDIISRMKKIIDKIPRMDDIDRIRGYEGMGSRYYFKIFGTVFNEEFEFSRRNRRPPKDPINCY